MTDTQLYLAVGVPTLAVLISMAINLLSILGIRGDIREIRTDISGIRVELAALGSRVSKIEGKIEGGRVIVER